MKKIVFFDIDGTLLPEGQDDISLEVISEIDTLMKNDVDVFICTGRCYHQAKKHIDAIKSPNYVCSNGQEVKYHDEIIYSRTFNKDEFNTVLNIVDQTDCGWGYETRENIFLPDRNFSSQLKDLLEGYGFQDIKVSNENVNDGVMQIWVFGSDEQVNATLKKLPKEFKYYKWNNQCAEILPVTESKAHGISRVEKALQDKNVEFRSYAFGDGVNDIEMFQHVDVAIVMGNAVEEIKEFGDIITSDCREDGIKKGIKLAEII
jgi:Cof subfamily protein (haloacid dehalogenase superfamily)